MADDFSLLSEVLQKALQESLTITTPTPIQRQALPALKDAFTAGSGDTLIQAQTGSGKTLAYALPLLDRILATHLKRPEDDSSAFRERVGTLALVIVPTRELAAQTQNTFNKLLSRIKPHWITTTALTGGDSRKSEKARLRRGCQIVIGTPGRLLDHLRMSEGWRRQGLQWCFVDEADRLADLGFEAIVKDIFSQLHSSVQLTLISATVTEKLKREFAGRKLNNPRLIKALQKEVYTEDAVEPADSFTAPEAIDQAFLQVPTRLRLLTLAGLLRSMFPVNASNQESTRVIVFFSCCAAVDFHYDLFTASMKSTGNLPPLLPARIQLLKLHGNLDQPTRISTFNTFIREGKAAAEPIQTILFCTDVAARGLDFPNLAGSIQYDAPCDIHDYIHRAGRTGRMSNKATTSTLKSKSFLFLMPSEEAYVERLQAKGMTSLHAVRFDQYLQWTERLDANKLTNILSKLAAKKAKTQPKDQDEADAEEKPIAALPTTLRARLQLFQRVLEAAVSADEELSELARDGFLSTVRAYATHPANEKEIFHVKRLHLGHLAASYCLDREPKQVGRAGGAAIKRPTGSLKDMRDARDGRISREMRKFGNESHKNGNGKSAFGGEQHQNRLNYSSHLQKKARTAQVVEEDDEPVKFAY